MKNGELSRSVEVDELLKAVTGWPRKWILFALSRQELCEKELCDLLGFEKSAISQNLTLLRQRGMVAYERDGLKKAFRLTANVRVIERTEVIELCVSGGPGHTVTIQFVLEAGILAKFDAMNKTADIEVKPPVRRPVA